MTVTNVHKDPEQLTMTITVELDANLERAWQLWADPRQLERWWGPPTYPATFVDHDLTPGAEARYYMTSPEGDKYYGWWEIIAVDPPRRLEVMDGFGDESGQRNEEMPAGRMVVTLDERDDKTVMAIISYFTSLEAMNQLIEMGQEEGMVMALGQIEAILADSATA
ncbi:MAG: SRPBCC domain-containing protein [Acidimicrobiales bacterium]